MSSPQNITLIGAGLVGSLLAILLAKRGFKVDLYERRPDMRLADISAGRSINLALANRGIYPLEQAGVMQQVRKILIPMKGRMVHALDGSQNFQAYGQRPEEVIYSVSRGDLNKICLDAAEATGLVNIHFNQRLDSVDLDNKFLRFTDEQTQSKQQVAFERIIGTDGSGSAVRDAIHQKRSEQLDIIPLGHSYKELTIPPGENNTFLLEKQALHIWPKGGYMIIALPNQDGSFTVTLFMANEGEKSFASIDTPEALQQFFHSEFPSLVPLIPDLESAYFNNPTGKLATVKCSPWHFEDIALILGDAAHAIVPFHGQGMNCGFEDAITLAETIDTLGPAWREVFFYVDHARKINGDAIADMAIENYITMRDSVTDEKFLLQNQLAFELEKRFPQYFCPRYSLVMFHRLPYAEAKSRGVLQSEILNLLTENIDTLDRVDYQFAKSLIEEKLTPFNFHRG